MFWYIYSGDKITSWTIICLSRVETIESQTLYNIKASIPLHRIYPRCSDRQSGANRVDSDQMPQNAASDQGLHCLAIIQQFLGIQTDSTMDLFEY